MEISLESEPSSSVLPDDLVSAEWVRQHLEDPRIRIVDMRGYVRSIDLGHGRQDGIYLGARDEFDEGHIPGAVYIDWTKDIVDLDAAVKVQIAPPERFKAQMEVLGIGDSTDVVVADHVGGHLATRLWWALRYYGHERVALLDGGYEAWSALGYALTTDKAPERVVTFTPRVVASMRSGATDVLEHVLSGDHQILDARAVGQYSGAVQRGTRGGHIPGAINFPATSLVRRDGRWKTGVEIQSEAVSAGIDLAQPMTAYCNGGVTATQLLFGLHRAGATQISNYDGSWNEWGERNDLPVEGNRDLFGSDINS